MLLLIEGHVVRAFVFGNPFFSFLRVDRGLLFLFARHNELSSFLPTRPEGKCLAAPISRSSFAFPKFRVVWLSPFQKITDKIQYLIKVCLKRFMTAIDNVDLGSGQVPLITMRFVHVEKH